MVSEGPGCGVLGRAGHSGGPGVRWPPYAEDPTRVSLSAQASVTKYWALNNRHAFLSAWRLGV